VSYSWVRRGQRKRMPYENPEGRRVNALAALAWGDTSALYWVAKPGSLQARHLVAFLTELPAAPVPTVVVLDNGSIHRSKETRAAIPALWARGVYLYFLPPYSPDLNAIEAALPALLDAVNGAFAAYEESLIAKYQAHPRPAA
jgi:putative transposase